MTLTMMVEMSNASLRKLAINRSNQTQSALHTLLETLLDVLKQTCLI